MKLMISASPDYSTRWRLKCCYISEISRSLDPVGLGPLRPICSRRFPSPTCFQRRPGPRGGINAIFLGAVSAAKVGLMEAVLGFEIFSDETWNLSMRTVTQVGKRYPVNRAGIAEPPHSEEREYAYVDLWFNLIWHHRLRCIAVQHAAWRRGPPFSCAIEFR